MNESNLSWLLEWYQSQCNGDWEHVFGIKIHTLDNPGWAVSINLEETDLENVVFTKIKYDNAENDWLVCFVAEKKFEGYCSPMNLPEVIQIFRNWVEEHKSDMQKCEKSM